MLKPRSFRPTCELLETRLAMSAGLMLYPVGFIGPLPAGAHAAPLVADSMIINPTSPNLGNPFTARLQITPPPDTVWTSTVWQYSVTYNGVVSNMRSATGTYNVATITADEPGTFSVQATATFMSTITPGLFFQIVLSKQVGVPVATTAVTTYGIGVQAALGSVTMAQDTVSSSLGKIGPAVVPIAQEWVGRITFPNTGHWIPGMGGWFPPTPSGTFHLDSGLIIDGISPGSSSAEWVATPIGGTFCTWSQDLQLAWTLSGSRGGVNGNYPEAAPLNSLNWFIKKISATRWELDQ